MFLFQLVTSCLVFLHLDWSHLYLIVLSFPLHLPTWTCKSGSVLSLQVVLHHISYSLYSITFCSVLLIVKRMSVGYVTTCETLRPAATTESKCLKISSLCFLKGLSFLIKSFSFGLLVTCHNQSFLSEFRTFYRIINWRIIRCVITIESFDYTHYFNVRLLQLANICCR